MTHINFSEEFLKEKINPYIKKLNIEEGYERFHINNIEYGVDLRETQGNNIKFTLYNLLNVFGGNCAELDVLVDMYTFNYKIKPKAVYGGLSYTIPIEDSIDTYKSGKVFSNEDLSYDDRVIFDGIIANTLYQTFYGYYKSIHPIMNKHLQMIVFGNVENDNL